MSILELLIISFIIVISFSLFVLSILSFKKSRSIKMLLISIVFLVFFIKVIIYNVSLYFSNINIFDSITNMWIFDLAVLLLLYIASMKR